MQPIYDHIDYRAFLSNYYEEKKKTTRFFSYRYFAQRTGSDSPSLLRDVINGRRNISGKMIGKFCIALQLNKKESQYFRSLVLFNQAKTAAEKQAHYAVLRSLAGAVKEAALNKDQYAFFGSWYIPIVRELVCIHDFGSDYDKIAQSVRPPITAQQARKALEFLLDKNFVRRNDQGAMSFVDAAIVIDDPVSSMVVKDFMVSMLTHASKAVHECDKVERHISGITIGVSRSGYEAIAAEVEAFKDRVKAIAARDRNSTRVYQVNVSVFPTSVDMEEPLSTESTLK